MIKTSNV